VEQEPEPGRGVGLQRGGRHQPERPRQREQRRKLQLRIDDRGRRRRDLHLRLLPGHELQGRPPRQEGPRVDRGQLRREGQPQAGEERLLHVLPLRSRAIGHPLRDGGLRRERVVPRRGHPSHRHAGPGRFVELRRPPSQGEHHRDVLRHPLPPARDAAAQARGHGGRHRREAAGPRGRAGCRARQQSRPERRRHLGRAPAVRPRVGDHQLQRSRERRPPG
jgi:hypothetical protein